MNEHTANINRHCEEHSDVAISPNYNEIASPVARNDSIGGNEFP